MGDTLRAPKHKNLIFAVLKFYNRILHKNYPNFLIVTDYLRTILDQNFHKKLSEVLDCNRKFTKFLVNDSKKFGSNRNVHEIRFPDFQHSAALTNNLNT